MAYPSDLVRTKNWGTEVLTDSDLEGQFDLIINWVMAAFNATTGHSHDGTSNEGPEINITNLTVASQAQGDLIYASSASAWARLAKGTASQVLTMNAGATAPEWQTVTPVVPAFENKLLHVRDEKTAGTAGGTLTSGSRQTRVLNTVKTNEISGASLSSNQITLPAGTYFAIGRSPGYTCGLHKIFLRNTTDGADLLNGANAYATPSGNQTDSVVQGRFTISAEKVLEIQHMVETTRSTDGAGDDCNLGAAEVYSEIMIWKVA